MEKKIKIIFGVSILLLFGMIFIFLIKPQNSDPKHPYAVNNEQALKVTEFTSEGIIKVRQYELGEISVKIKNQNNCIFKTTVSLGYETKKTDEAIKILQTNESDIKNYIESFLSKQTPEKLKKFSTEQNLEIELVNGINKLLKQIIVLILYRENSNLDCK